MKSILIYYSYGGNTRHVAEKVAAEIGADIAEIETVKPYTGSYDHVVDQGQKEVNSGFLPKIRQINADLSEKSVYPFATNGGWIGHTFKDFENACKGATVHAGLNVRFNEEKQITSDDEIQKWAKQIVK